MEITVPDQLAALAHPKRLDVFRLLMRRFPDAVPAGEIAAALDLRANTASVYLAALRQAGLISQTRKGTFQLYQVRMDEVRKMFGEMFSECCQNRPDICLSGLNRTRQTFAGTDPIHVLFLCSQNSARSIMAEALLNGRSDRFQAYSAGTEPAPAPNPIALELVAEHGLDIDKLYSKSLDRFLASDGPKMDMVITVCDNAANEDCGHWPGSPLHAHWSVPDPVSRGTAHERRVAMDQAYTTICEKVDALIRVPLDTPDLTALQAHLDQIGRMHASDFRI